MVGKIVTVLGAAALTLTSATGAAPAGSSSVKTVVLVHGGFVDGSEWAGVHRILARDGYRVIVVQNPTTSLADDVAVTKQAIASAPGEVICLDPATHRIISRAQLWAPPRTWIEQARPGKSLSWWPVAQADVEKAVALMESELAQPSRVRFGGSKDFKIYRERLSKGHECPV
jgi:pimeloyl-ACP methyl ester carboxylesterase